MKSDGGDNDIKTISYNELVDSTDYSRLGEALDHLEVLYNTDLEQKNSRCISEVLEGIIIHLVK